MNLTKVKKAVDDLEWSKSKKELGVKDIDFEDEDDKNKFWLHKEPKWGIKKHGQ